MTVELSNNSVTSNNFIVILENDGNYDDNYQNLSNWFEACVQTIPISVIGGETIKWYVISDIPFNCKFDTGIPSTKQTFFIHVGDNDSLVRRSEKSPDGLLVVNEKYHNENINISAQTLMDTFLNPPSYVTKIGVSGVSREYMMEMWEVFLNSSAQRKDVNDLSGFSAKMRVRSGDTMWVEELASISSFGWD